MGGVEQALSLLHSKNYRAFRMGGKAGIANSSNSVILQKMANSIFLCRSSCERSLQGHQEYAFEQNTAFENEEELMTVLPKTNHPNYLFKVLMTDCFSSVGPDWIPA